MLINIIDAYTIIIIFCEDSLDAILMQYEFRGIITDFKLEIYHKNFGKFQNQIAYFIQLFWSKWGHLKLMTFCEVK